MLRLGVGGFLLLHGLVHLLYVAQSRRLSALQAGVVWPDGSWAFSRLLGEDGARKLASLACALAALGFVGSGVGVFAGQGWWRPAVTGAAAFSSAIFVLFWDGVLEKLADRGALALLIDGAILLSVLGLRWPDLGF